MNLNDERLDLFLNQIEKTKRNKINDHAYVDKLHYIDPNGYLDKLNIPIDHVIFGRRGSGKTLLLQKSINRHKDNHCITIDCELFKHYKDTKIVINILKTIVASITRTIDANILNKLKRQFNIKSKSISKYLFSKEIRKTTEKEYLDLHFLFTVSKALSNNLINLENLQDIIEYDYEVHQVDVESVSKKSDCALELNVNSSISSELKDSLISAEAQINLSTAVRIQTSSINDHTVTEDRKSSEKRRIVKKDIVDSLLISVVELINKFHKYTNERIILFVDDFYYINRSAQPYVVNYIHQMNKNSINNSFSFKLSSLPNRFKMNNDNEHDLAIDHDFSAINLDRDLSDIISVKDFLIDICSALVDNVLASNEIESLFANSVITYAIVSCGGNPRGFLILLEKLIRLGRKQGRSNIGKTMVYSTVYDSISEKENSIEEDEVLPKSKVLDAVGLLKTEVIDKHNTNVFLYPVKLYERHSSLLRSLITFKYLHQLKDSIVSDIHNKETFVPFCIDMSLYVTQKGIKRGFDFREFWVRDEKSRLMNITSAPKWNFSDEFVDS